MESRFDGLRAVFFNGTLKRSPEPSNTDGLIRLSADLMARHGVEVEVIRTIDRDIAVGVYPDMSEHGWATDEWPTLYEKVLAADILVLCGTSTVGRLGRHVDNRDRAIRPDVLAAAIDRHAADDAVFTSDTGMSTVVELRT